MTVKLFFQALSKITLGFILMSLLIFLPAGTLSYFNGWLLIALLFVPMFIAGIIMMFKNPELLKRRLKAKEEKKEQKFVILFSAFVFIAGFITAGIDFRFNLTTFPEYVVITAVFVFIFAYILYAEVIRENEFLSRVIEVSENQRVINTGLYRIVRHPMYFATILLFLSMPVILNSLYSFLIFLIYPFIIIKRIKYEEIFLEENLKGYKEYKKKVRFRMIPFIW